MSIPYSYGGFVLHDNVSFFVDAIDPSWTLVNAVTTKIARLEGLKKTGESIDARTLTMTVSVISPDGTREGLRTLLDALNVALNKRSQNLVTHSDGRYFVCDCVNVNGLIKNPAYVALQLTFMAYQPWGYAANPMTLHLPGVRLGGASSPFITTIPITNIGTVFARPTITLLNTGTPTITSISISNATSGVTLTPSGTLSLASGDYATIVCDPFAAGRMGYTITKNGSTVTLYDFTGTYPTLDIGVTSWQLQANASSAPTFDATWTWTPRYLG